MLRILLFSFLFLGISVKSQNQISKFDFKISYDFYYVPDSLKVDNKHHEKLILLFSNNESIFQSEKKFIIDSVFSTLKDETIKRRPFLKVNNVIYRNIVLKIKNLIYSELVNGENLAYYDDIKDMKWSFKESATKKIANFNCKQAVVNYKGRSFVAWYTVEIAVPYGPYKFGNLPGLILEIYDTKGFFHYLATKVQHNNFEIAINTDYKILEKNEFLKHKINYLSTIFKPFVYNPIELKP